MMYKQPTTKLCIFAVLLHTIGVICGTTIVPDIKPTPPLEFPSDDSVLRILHVSHNTMTKQQFIYNKNNNETTTVGPFNPTPPLEFPSDGHIVRIVQVSDTNMTKFPFLFPGNNDEITTGGPTSQLKEEIKRKPCDGVLKSLSQPINVIAKISDNHTDNYIENKFYNNSIEESNLWSSITLSVLVLMVMAAIVLVSSAVCLKIVENKKILKRQLLIEDCDDSAMSDLIHVQHV